MSAYRLYDVGLPYKKIVHGRKWVGRVVKCADGRWLARINNARGPATEFYGRTETEAFEEAVAHQFGYKSADALHIHNAGVRAQNKAQRQRVSALAHQYMHGNLEQKIDAIDKILGIKK